MFISNPKLDFDIAVASTALVINIILYFKVPDFITPLASVRSVTYRVEWSENIDLYQVTILITIHYIQGVPNVKSTVIWGNYLALPLNLSVSPI